MTDRRTFVGVVAAGLIAIAAAAFPQQLVTVYRVAWLQTGPAGSDQQFIDEIKKSLRDLGYVEGKNIVFDIRSADGDPGRLPSVAAELVALKFDVIVSGATLGPGLPSRPVHRFR